MSKNEFSSISEKATPHKKGGEYYIKEIDIATRGIYIQ
jgi:hypothetical protein